MFDKNTFKSSFHAWAMSHGDATPGEAMDHCLSLVPEAYRQRYSWLIIESVRWFEFLQERRQNEHNLSWDVSQAHKGELC